MKETAVTTMAHDAMQLARNEGVNALVQQALQADTPAKAFICLAAASFRGAAEAAATLSQTPKETIAALVLEQQIAALEQQDAAHDQNIAALEQEIAERKQVIALEQQIAALEQQNAARDEKIAAGEQEIAALEQEIAAREARMV